MIIPVTAKAGKRPSPKNGPNAKTHCFYCKEPLGVDTHKPDCVVLKRTVVVEMRVRYVTAFPQSWSSVDIENFLNLSSHCADNELNIINDQMAVHEGCLCGRAEFSYIEEATEQAHDYLGYVPRHNE